MGRHVWFRTPTKQDRLDVLDLYLGKVAHDAGAGPAAQARGDRARHERLRARDARAGDVDGADDRAPLGPRGVDLGRPRRGNDHSRGRHRSRHRVHPGGEPRRRNSRGGPCRRRPRLLEGRGVNAALHPDARRRARAPPGAREGGALQSLPERGVRAARLGARRDGRRARVLRRELERRRRRRHERHRAGGVHGRRLGDGAGAVRDHAARGRDGGGGARAHPQALREDRPCRS